MQRRIQLLCVIVMGIVGSMAIPEEAAATTKLPCEGCINLCPSNIITWCVDRGCFTSYATCSDIGGECGPPFVFGRSHYNCYAM
jgi:hypothetical protein